MPLDSVAARAENHNEFTITGYSLNDTLYLAIPIKDVSVPSQLSPETWWERVEFFILSILFIITVAAIAAILVLWMLAVLRKRDDKRKYKVWILVLFFFAAFVSFLGSPFQKEIVIGIYSGIVASLFYSYFSQKVMEIER